MLLDGVSGGLAGAIGLALADVVAGDPGYAITTFILKFIIGLVCGAVSHKVIHLRTFPTGNKLKYVAAVTASAFSGLLVNVFTDRSSATSATCTSLASRGVRLRRDQDRQRCDAGQLPALHRLRRCPVHRPAPRPGEGTLAAEGVILLKPSPWGEGGPAGPDEGEAF
mgnify:CR=1 FL=1